MAALFCSSWRSTRRGPDKRCRKPHANSPGTSWRALPGVGQQRMRGRSGAWKLAAPSSAVPDRARLASRPRALGLSASLPGAPEKRAAHSERCRRRAGRARDRSEALLLPRPTSLRSFGSSATPVPLGRPHGCPRTATPRTAACTTTPARPHARPPARPDARPPAHGHPHGRPRTATPAWLQRALSNPVAVWEQQPLHLRIGGCGGTSTSVSPTGDPWGGHGGREKWLRSTICWTYSYSLPLSKEGRREGLVPAEAPVTQHVIGLIPSSFC